MHIPSELVGPLPAKPDDAKPKPGLEQRQNALKLIIQSKQAELKTLESKGWSFPGSEASQAKEALKNELSVLRDDPILASVENLVERVSYDQSVLDWVADTAVRTNAYLSTGARASLPGLFGKFSEFLGRAFLVGGAKVVGLRDQAERMDRYLDTAAQGISDYVTAPQKEASALTDASRIAAEKAQSVLRMMPVENLKAALPKVPAQQRQILVDLIKAKGGSTS